MEFSKGMDVQGEKELERDTSVSLEGSSKDVITKRSGACSKVKGVVHIKASSNTVTHTVDSHTLTALSRLSLVLTALSRLSLVFSSS